MVITGPTGVVHQGHVGFNTDQGRFEVYNEFSLPDQLLVKLTNRHFLSVARSS